MIRLREASSGGGGTGDIKSDGSVNFVATENWNNGGANNSFVSFNEIRTQRSGFSLASILQDGTLRLNDGTGASDFKTHDVIITPADMQTAFSVPVQIIPALASNAFEVITICGFMPFNTTTFSSTTMTFFIAGTNSPQFIMNGILQDNGNPIATGYKYIILPIDKSNMANNSPLMMMTDSDSPFGDCITRLTVVYRIKRFS